jgi:hypothetical protein
VHILTAVLENLSHCGLLLIVDLIVQTMSKLSGDILTSWFNSLMMAALIACFARSVGLTYDQVRKQIFGDDLAVGFGHDWMYARFAEYVCRFGVILTDASDKTMSPRACGLEGYNFLKRSLTSRDGVWYAPLEKLSVVKSLMFPRYRNGTLDLDDFKGVLLSAAAECVVAGCYDDVVQLLDDIAADYYGDASWLIEFREKTRVAYLTRTIGWDYVVPLLDDVGVFTVAAGEVEEVGTGVDSVPKDTVVAKDAGIESGSGDVEFTTPVVLPQRQFVSRSMGAEDVRSVFARPVFLNQITWGTSITSLSASVPVPGTTFALPGIAGRVSYHTHIRGTLVIRLTSTTTTHHYGRMHFCLLPSNTLPTVSLTNTIYQKSSSFNGAFMDAGSVNSVELRLPFPSRADWFNFQGTMGWADLHYSCISPLMRDDGGTVGSPVINVFLSIEDAEMAGLTPYTVAAGEKKGGKEEKMTTGPISAPLATVSKIGGVFKSVPGLGWLGSTVEAAAGVASSVAAALGYSRPVEFIQVQKVTNVEPYGDVCHSNVPDPGTRLTLNTGAGAPLMASGLGQPDDGLTWENTIHRWGLVDLVTWTQASAKDTRLVYFPVTPGFSKFQSGSRYYTTPLSYFQAFFDRWWGDIDFCLRIASTPYIHGQLLFVYTPNATSASAITCANSMATSQYCIIDLGKETDKVIRIKWSSSLLFKMCGDPVAINTASPQTANGYVSLYVLEPVSGPVTTGIDLTIQIWMRAGQNFRFSGVNDYLVSEYLVAAGEIEDARFHGLDTTVQPAPAAPPLDEVHGKQADQTKSTTGNEPKDFKAAAGELPEEKQAYTLMDVNAPLPVSCEFGYDIDDEAFEKLNGGDSVPSLRVALKRYWRAMAWRNGKVWSTVANWTIYLHQVVPHMPPCVTSLTYSPSANTGAVANPWALSQNLLSATMCCFGGYFGSIRHQITAKNQAWCDSTSATTFSGGNGDFMQMLVTKDVPLLLCAETYNGTQNVGLTYDVGYQANNSGAAATSSAIIAQSALGLNMLSRGAAVVNTVGRFLTSTTDHPLSSPFRWCAQAVASVTGTIGEADGVRIIVEKRHPAPLTSSFVDNGNNILSLIDDVCIGEDFNVVFFMGTPMLNYAANSTWYVGLTSFPTV